MRLYQFGTVVLQEPNAESSIPIEARDAYVDLNNGAFDQDRGVLYLQKATTTYSFEFREDIHSNMQALVKQLGKGRGVLFAIDRNDIQYASYAKLSRFSRSTGPSRYDCEQPMAVTFVREYPYWLLADDGWYLDTGETLDSGLYLDGHRDSYFIQATPYTATITNSGTARAADGTFYIIPQSGGSIVNPKIENFTNGMSIRYNGTVNAGEQLVIDWLTKTAELDGTSVFDDIELSGERQIDWFGLETDDNSLRVSGTLTGNIDVHLVWKRHYL